MANKGFISICRDISFIHFPSSIPKPTLRLILVCSAHPGYDPGSLSREIYLILLWLTRGHSCKPAHLAPLDLHEQQLYSEAFPDCQALHLIT